MRFLGPFPRADTARGFFSFQMHWIESPHRYQLGIWSSILSTIGDIEREQRANKLLLKTTLTPSPHFPRSIWKLLLMPSKRCKCTAANHHKILKNRYKCSKRSYRIPIVGNNRSIQSVGTQIHTKYLLHWRMLAMPTFFIVQIDTKFSTETSAHFQCNNNNNII